MPGWSRQRSRTSPLASSRPARPPAACSHKASAVCRGFQEARAGTNQVLPFWSQASCMNNSCCMHMSEQPAWGPHSWHDAVRSEVVGLLKLPQGRVTCLGQTRVYVVAPTPASTKPKALRRTLMARVIDDVTVSEIVQVIAAVSRKDRFATRLQAASYNCAAVHAAALDKSRLARIKVGVMGCKPQTVLHLAEPSPQTWVPRGVCSCSF